MPYIGRDLNRGNYLKLDDISSSFNGSTQTFNLTVGGSAFTPGSAFSILVSVGGVIQEPESAYQINNSEITFANAPTAQDSFFCIALGVSLGIGVPGNGTVNGTQMAKPFNYDGFFFLDDANNRVGIGSTQPTVALDVDGIIKASSFNGGVSAGVVTCTGLDLNGNGDVSGNFVIDGDLTVNGTTSTIDTNLIGVDRIEVTTALTNVAVAVTHNGTGDLVRLYDGASQVVTIDDTGNVGIGSAIPAAKLDVFGQTHLDNVSIAGVTTVANDTRLIFGANATANTNLRIKHNSSNSRNEYRATYQDFFTTDLRIHNISNNDHFAYFWSNQISLFASGNERLQITGSSVKILNAEFLVEGDTKRLFLRDTRGTGNTARPGIWMQDSASSNQFFIGNGSSTDTHLEFRNLTTGDLVFKTDNNAERLRITSGGDLRLGLDSVANVTDSAHYIMTLTGKSGQTGAGAIAFRDPSANTDGFIFADNGNLFITADYDNTTADSSIRFRVDGSSEKLRIDSNGKLGVGDFSSTSIAQALHVRGSAPEIFLEHTGGYDMTLTTSDGMGMNGITVNGGFLSLAYNNKNIVMCRTGGNVGIVTTAPQSKLEIDGRFRILDNSDGTPSSGKGLEISYYTSDDKADILSYDRGASAYKDLMIRGNSIDLRRNNTSLLLVGTGGANGTVGFSTTAALVTNGEKIAVRGYSSFKSTNPAYAAIYCGSEGNTTDTANALILFNNNGANRGGIGYVPNTGELRFNNQYFMTFCTGSSILNGTERLRIKSDGKIKFATSNSSTDYLEYGSNPRLWLRCPSNMNGLRIDASTTPLEIRSSDATGRQISVGGAPNSDISISGDYSLSSGGYDSSPRIYLNATRHNGSSTVTSFQTSIQAVATSNTNNTGYLGFGGSASPDDLTIKTNSDVCIGNFTTVDTRNTGGLHIAANKGISFKAYSSVSDSRNWRIRNDDSAWGNLDFTVGDNNSTDIGSGAADTVLSLAANHNVGINEVSPDKLLHLSANNTSVSANAFTSANNTIRFTDTDTTVTSNQPGGTIEWETLDSNAAGVNAYIATKNSNTGYSSMHFATGNTTTLGVRLNISQEGHITPGNNSQNIGDGTTNFASIWASTRFRGNDNVKLVLGASQNLVVRYDGSNNIIGSPVGNHLHIKSGTGDNDNQFCAKFNHNSSVQLYHNNQHVFDTTSTGFTAYGGGTNSNGQINIQPRGTGVYATLSFKNSSGGDEASIGTHSGADTIYYVCPTHLFHIGGAYKLQMTGNVMQPYSGVTNFDLGSTSNRFQNIYTGDLDLSNETKGGNDVDGTWGSYTIQEGENDLFLINKRSGKKYKFNLTEVS